MASTNLILQAILSKISTKMTPPPHRCQLWCFISSFPDVIFLYCLTYHMLYVFIFICYLPHLYVSFINTVGTQVFLDWMKKWIDGEQLAEKRLSSHFGKPFPFTLAPSTYWIPNIKFKTWELIEYLPWLLKTQSSKEQ